MKHILIACLVFALCLAVGLFSLFYVRASGEETVTLLERSIRQAEEVPPTLPHEPQPHRRQHPQPVDAPATVPLCCVQVQVQVQVGFVVDVPPTEPVVCLQQGLQHRC